MLTILEWAGALGGAAGAMLLALRCRWSGYGFVLFLASNVAWFAYGMMTETFGMVVMQVVCTGTSLIGVWRWLIEPHRAVTYPETTDMVPAEVILLATSDRSVLQGVLHG